MPNQAGRYSKSEVLESGLPYYIPRSNRWTHEPYKFAVLLSKSRCKHFGLPILSNDHEKPSAFRFAANAGSGTNDLAHRYVPLYDRTSVFQSGELDINQLFPHEMMGVPEVTNH